MYDCYMVILIVAVIIGIGMGLFATQNASMVPLTFGTVTLMHVPLYLIALFSLLGGLLLSGIFHLINGISSQIIMNGKNRELKKTETTIQELNAKLHDLEQENTRLRTEKEDGEQTPTPTIGEQMRHFFHPPEQTPSL